MLCYVMLCYAMLYHINYTYCNIILHDSVLVILYGLRREVLQEVLLDGEGAAGDVDLVVI